MTEYDLTNASSTTAPDPQTGHLNRRKVFQAPETLQGDLDALVASLEQAAGGQTVSEGQAIRAALNHVLERRTDPEFLKQLLASIRAEAGVSRALHAARMKAVTASPGGSKQRGGRRIR